MSLWKNIKTSWVTPGKKFILCPAFSHLDMIQIWRGDKNLHIDSKNKWVKSQVFTSSSCLICGRKSRLKDCRASLSLSSNVFLFKQVPFFDALFIPFLANDKISKTCLSLCTSLTTASNCWLIRRCWSSSKMQVFSISSWCLSSWKVEFMQPRSLKRETSSLKFVTES